GVKIHASCKNPFIERVESLCRVGERIVINNFSLSHVTGFDRVTSHVYKMSFVCQTSISESLLQCNNMFLDIHAFDNVLSGSLNTNFLIDVIGEVLDLGGMDVRLKCCLWGKCAELLTSEAKVPNNGDICSIRFAKIRKNRGELQVSNSFDSSLVLINPDLAETHALKQMFQRDSNSIVPFEPKETKIRVQTIQQIKHTDKDLTGESNIILLDSAARTIVNASAAKLLNGSYDKFEDPEVLTIEIVEIVGKTYGFGVSGDENNIVYGAEIFEAIKCWSLDDILWKRIKSLHKLSLSKKKQCTNVTEIENMCHDEAKEKKSG
ncbi:unnamed protein product, partial [Brassica oleracea]